MKRMFVALFLLPAFFLSTLDIAKAQAPQDYLRNNTFTHWESPHVHPLDLTPDGTRLLAVNTAAGTLEIFDSSNANGLPVFLKSVQVGIDPVSVRARTNSEAWVVNVISGTVSVVNLQYGMVTATLAADTEPADVIFAGTSSNLAMVSCAQAKTLLVFNANGPTTPVSRIPINGEQPRALAKSGDGRFVYLAIFESGNQTTQVTGGKSNGFEHDIVRDSSGPYGGVNVPPNSGTTIVPAINPALPAPPPVSMIVKRTVVGGVVKWMDDNNGDWSKFINGSAAQNGTNSARVAGWDLPDRDVAIVDTSNNNAVTYQSGLMNILMAMAVNPATGKVTVVGTDATNQIRYEPNLQSTFVRVNMGQFTPGAANTVTDLNPHLNYAVKSVPMATRQLSIGDPRGIVWNAAGTKAYVTGMGSNNVAIVTAAGARSGLINVGQGPTGIVLQESNGRGFVLNKFDATISTINLNSGTVTGKTPLLYDPTPAAIKSGRPLLYNTQMNSGLGQASCASCHVDGKWDRLAWDLGNPAGSMVTNSQGVSFHPMKGPLLTMTLADTMQAPDLHWRGDRPMLEDFEGAFQTLQGADQPATASQVDTLRRFLSTISLPPNPYRNLDDSYATSVTYPGPNGTAGPVGNAALGAQEFENSCRSCHTGQTARGAAFISGNDDFGIGQVRQPPTWKNFYKRIGLWYGDATASNSGFGFQQDGSFDSTQAHSRDGNMYAFMLSVNGGFPYEPAGLNATNWSNFTHAAVGKQVTLSQANPTDTTGLLAQLKTLAQAGTIGLIVKGKTTGYAGPARGWMYLGNDLWQSDHAGETTTTAGFLSAIPYNAFWTFTAVPAESVVRLGIDADGDGILDLDDPNPTVPDFTVTNLAQTGTATSSSSPLDGQHAAAAAIDGSTIGYFDQNSLYHSSGQNAEWWQVDLGTSAQISLIQLFNRLDCCADRLQNVSVFLSQVPFTSGTVAGTRAQAGVQEFFISGAAGMLPQIPMQAQARYVRVQLNDPNYLQLAEVRVMGYAIGSFTNPGTQTSALGTAANLPLAFANTPGTTYTFSAIGLPAGLSINSSTGVISGTVNTSASASNAVTVTATGLGNPTVSFTWNITGLTPPAIATVCAVDNGTCVIPANSTAAVWYGAGKIWNVFPSRSGSFTCLPNTFGIPDPVPGVQKSCQLVFNPPPSTATVCAVDFGTCAIPANNTATLWYGVGNIWNVFANRSGSVTCLPGTFGIQDPVPGVQKSCQVVLNTAAASAPAVVSLASYYNVYGIGTIGTTPSNGGFDNSGYAYATSTIGTQASYGGLVFPLGPANAADAVRGGTVALPAGSYTSLYVLAATGYGPATNQVFTVKYSDGTTSSYTQSVSDWANPGGFAGETTVLQAANRVASNGQANALPVNIYGYAFALTKGKTAVSVSLPGSTLTAVFGIGLK